MTQIEKKEVRGAGWRFPFLPRIYRVRMSVKRRAVFIELVAFLSVFPRKLCDQQLTKVGIS
jgi:hypothetical protein